MKTVWIVNPYIPIMDSSSRQASMARFLMKRGYNVLIVCTPYGENVDKDQLLCDKKINDINYCIINIDFIGIGNVKRVSKQIKFQKVIINKLEKLHGHPDIIINNFAGLFGDFAFYFKKMYNTKVILDILDFWPEVWVDLGYMKKSSILARYLYYREKKSYEKADAIIFSMKGGKDYIIEKKWDTQNGGKVDISKVYYINNATDLELVCAEAKENPYFEEVSECTDIFKIGYIGAISAPNDISLVLETAKLAFEKGKEGFAFIIYGYGSDYEYAKEYIKKNNLHNVVMKGKLEKKYFVNAIRKCDIALLNFKEMPTLRFGLSNNKFFMYCSSSVPVLSTVRPKYSVIENYHNGIIVDHTPEEVLRGIDYFMQLDANSYKQYKDRSYKVACDHDYSVTLQLLEDIIRGEKL